jgi:hypothetical protein
MCSIWTSDLGCSLTACANEFSVRVHVSKLVDIATIRLPLGLRKSVVMSPFFETYDSGGGVIE